MRKMKDSGIEWIGEIPEEWGTQKMRFACEIITDFTANGSFADLAKNVVYLDYEDYAMLVRTADLSNKREISPVYINQHAYNYLKKSNLFGGEIILPNIGSVGEVYLYTPLYQCASLAPNAIMCRAIDCDKYLFYLFSTNGAKQALLELGNTTTQIKFNKTQLRNFSIVMPPLLEQHRIADFLDTKCAKIDSLITTIQSEIDTLEQYKRSLITEAVTKGLDPKAEMKDSGIEWIGEMPKEWNFTKVKFVSHITGSKSYTQSDIVGCGEGAILINPSNLNNMKMDYSKCTYINWQKYNECRESKVYNGDVLFVKTASIGKTALVKGLPLSATINPQLIVFKQISMNNRFFSYVFQTSIITTQTELSAIGGVIPTIPQSKISNFVLPEPPIDEQCRIADFLDVKCEKIDAIIDKLKSKLSDLESYKKSLIFEYVTGKKEVPVA